MAASSLVRRNKQKQRIHMGGPMAAHRPRAIFSSPSRFLVGPSSPISAPIRYRMMATTYCHQTSPRSPFRLDAAVDKENGNCFDCNSNNKPPNNNDNTTPMSSSMDDNNFVLSPQLPFLISPANIITCPPAASANPYRGQQRRGTKTTNLESSNRTEGVKLGGVNITVAKGAAPPDLSSLVLPSPVLYLNVSHPSYIPGRVPRHPVTMYRPTMVVPSLDAYPKIFNISSLRLPLTDENNYPE